MSFPLPEISTDPRRKRHIFLRPRRWNFDIDRYLNPYVPPSPLRHLPTWASRWFGYREEDVEDVGNILASVWAAVGAFAGLAVVSAIFNATPSIQARYSGVMVASFGASAILEYNTLMSPLGQPRNAVLGHTFSALVGVAISKLFALHPLFALQEDATGAVTNLIGHPSNIHWIPPAVACALSSVVMLLTNTVHPPGGASAVLAASDPGVRAMGWWFVLLVLWGSMLMIAVGLIVNNLPTWLGGRRFPVWWWTPAAPAALDMRGWKRRRVIRGAGESLAKEEDGGGGVHGVDEEKGEGRVGGQVDGTVAEGRVDAAIAVLEGMELTEAEREMLGRMKWRLRRGYDGDDEESEGRSTAETTSRKGSIKSVVIA